jgi:hypothetical protein
MMQGKDSERSFDGNGFLQVKGNPITKVCVSDYLGREISSDLEPDKVYKVFRPPEVLKDPETIKSFKLLPVTDGHEHLGAREDGLTPAEEKGVDGTIGSDVFFEDGYLKADIKIFSEALKRKIQCGKKELSIGYDKILERRSGNFNGEDYEFVFTAMRGNHLAVVDKGRMGPDVAIMDSKICIIMRDRIIVEKWLDVSKKVIHNQDEANKKGEKQMPDKENEEMEDKKDETMKENEDEKDKTEDKKDKEMSDTDDTNDRFEKRMKKFEEDVGELKSLFKARGSSDKKTSDSELKDKVKNIVTNHMDTLKSGFLNDAVKDLQEKTDLASRASHHIGVFDHSDMNTKQVARYIVDKAGLKYVKDGQEITACKVLLDTQGKQKEYVVNGKSSDSIGVNLIEEKMNAEINKGV